MTASKTLDKAGWRIEIIESGVKPAKDFTPNPLNWRLHPEHQRDALAGVINEVGLIDRVLENKRTGHLIDGHLRWEMAMREDEDTPLPYDAIDVDEATEHKILATLDPLAAMATTDTEKLDELLRDIQTGEAAVQEMLSELAEGAGLDYGAEPEPVEDPEPQIDRAEELREQWGVEYGQLWTIPSNSVDGREHRLLCGDSTNAEDVARLMDGAKADMVFADPPYGISIVAANVSVGGGEAYDIPFGGRKKQGLGTVGGSKPFGSKRDRGTVGASNIVEAGKYLPVLNDDTTDTALNAYRLFAEMCPKAVHIWWGGNYYANELPPSPCWIVWDKDNTGNFADCELAWTNQKTAARMFRHRWNGMLKDSERGVRRVHPTQKPVALAEWCFEKYGDEGQTIVDPFLGSAITAVAAEKLGRICYGIEYEPDYIAVSLQRLADMGLTPALQKD